MGVGGAEGGGCKANLEFDARLKFGECIKKRGGGRDWGGMEFSTSAQTKMTLT